jgi:PKD repeat protein
MKKFYVVLLISLFSFFGLAGYAQIEQGGLPLSIEYPQLLKSSLAFETMPAIDVQKLMAEDSINDNYSDIPWRFGENIEVKLDLNNSGTWDYFDKGDKLWRLGIQCPGAFTINLTFDNYHLPPGAKLFVYNTDQTHIIGAFTDFNNQEDKLFATTLVKGDEIIIEYYEPPYPAFPGELSLMQVTHGYRDAYSYAKAFGNSGSCNVNVACPQSAGMENQIRSVCMLVSGGNGFCSGALINNTAQDGKPYVLSADHCYSTPGSVVYWFNWQSPTCSNPSSSPPYNSMSGATQRARNSTSDFWLVELNTTIPSNYNVYFSGWNRTTDNYITGKIWGIHHPSGDIKKISWSFLGVSTTTYLQTAVPGNSSHWRITNWSDGTTTEGGSSGSPLFDPNGRIIGQLHGGYASCSSITSDWYGKFGVSWTGGGTNATRLSNWLDPTNSGVAVLDGYDPNAVIAPPVANFSANNTNPIVGETVTFSDLSSNTPTSWAWQFSPSTVTYVGGTSSASKNPQVQFNALGYYSVTLTATNAYGSDGETKTNYINVIDCTINTFPYLQGFENGGSIPSCWSQEYVSGSLNWTYQNGGYNGNPSSAHGGSYNALLYINSTTASVTRLITPVLNLSVISNPVLTFWHTQAFWSPDQDELRVYYKTSAGGAWTLLQTYTGNITTWTLETINLPNPSSTYYIAFQGTAKYGYGVCIDDVAINGTVTTPPVANFSASTTTPYIGQTVTFTDQSTNNPTSWSWSFSPSTVTYVGGTSSTSQNPQLQFNAGGLYSVTLTATNAGGSDGETKNNYISVLYAPVANFSANNLNPAIGQTVTFTDLSTNSPTSWGWSFSPATVTYVGGTSSSSQNPQVHFTAGGSYSVTLTATNASGSDPETKNNYISVLYAPVADFDADNYAPVIGQTVYFWDISLNNPTFWTWAFNPTTVSFVGGTNEFSQDPEVQFNAGGSYTVTLTATNASGSDSEIKTGFINVPYPPVADFTANNIAPIIGQTVTFTDLTTNNPFMWVWSFNPATITYVGGTNAISQNPQVIFNASGAYTVTLTATSVGGNDTEIKTDYINVQNPIIDLDITVYLEGPFNGATMTPGINSILPLNQPYNVSPWNYTGTESVGSIPNGNIVDWILVELRDAASAASATSATMMDRQAAFLLSNGKVVGLDGSSTLQFNNSLIQQLFVVIWHRNHLGVMTSSFVTESGGSYTYNFSTGATQAYGNTAAHKQIGPGIWGMMGGDGNRDGNVTLTDESPLWEAQAGTTGYLESDYNLDSQTDNKDKDDIWAPNIGSGTMVPN